MPVRLVLATTGCDGASNGGRNSIGGDAAEAGRTCAPGVDAEAMDDPEGRPATASAAASPAF
jgi:hypothetical protein